jgi:hypothetical protein
MLLGRYLHGVAEDGRAAMGCGPQPDYLRCKIDSPIIFIRGFVMERDMYSQNFTVLLRWSMFTEKTDEPTLNFFCQPLPTLYIVDGVVKLRFLDGYAIIVDFLPLQRKVLY